jgi:integrase
MRVKVMASGPTKRKDGRYQASVIIPWTKKRKYVYADSRKECNRLLNNLIEQIESGDFTNIEKLTVKGYLEKWLETYCSSLSPTTVTNYEGYLKKHIYPEIGNILLAKLMPMNIKEIYNKLQEQGYKSKTILNIHRILSKAFKDAVSNNRLARNPCDSIKPPPVDTPYIKVYTEKEFNRLLDVVEGSKEELPILLAGLAGLRRGEIFGLKWEDINFDTGRISIKRNAVRIAGKTIIKTPKTKGSTRSFILPEYVLERLKKYRGIGFVYPREDGGPENGDAYSKRFQNLLFTHGLPKIRFHDLRHFNATQMLKRGIKDKEAAARLGHWDASMTKRYQHVLEEMDKGAAAALDNIVSKRAKAKSLHMSKSVSKIKKSVSGQK